MKNEKVHYPDLIERLNREAEEKAAREILARSRTKQPRKRPSDREHEIQTACFRWFSIQHPEYRGLLFAVPNGGKRNAIVAAKLKAEGVVAGVADLMLAIPKWEESTVGKDTCMLVYHGLFIEMKTESKSSRQRDTQKEWQEKVESQGYAYRICRSVDEFMTTINDYLSNGKQEPIHD